MVRWLIRHCGRVVKAMDLKSIGFSRAGSNPANVVFYIIKIHTLHIHNTITHYNCLNILNLLLFLFTQTFIAFFCIFSL